MSDNQENVSKVVLETAKQTQEKLEQENTRRTVDTERTVEMSNGVVFTVLEVPQMIYADLRNAYKEPVPPIFYNKDYDREEPNPNDPRYLAEKANYEVKISTAIMDLSILFGSKIKYIPENVASPDSEEFNDRLKIILKTYGYTKEEIAQMGKQEKYLYWVKYYATSGKIGGENGDMDKLFSAIGRMSGVPEEDVREAVDKFRD